MNTGLEKTKILSNILLIILVSGNIFFSIQYVENIKRQASVDVKEESASIERLKTARFLKFFIDTVLNTQQAISYDDRVRLENDIRQLGDKNLTAEWNKFVNSKDTKLTQEAAVTLMAMLTSKMI